jgi:hypothetical protein
MVLHRLVETARRGRTRTWYYDLGNFATDFAEDLESGYWGCENEIPFRGTVVIHI